LVLAAPGVMVTTTAVAPSTAIANYLYILKSSNQPMMIARTTAVAVASAKLQCSKQQKWQQQEQCWQAALGLHL